MHCFEPSAHGFAKLQALEDKRLFLWKYAVSNYKGVATLTVAPDHQQSNTISTPTKHLKAFPEVRYNGTERVNVTRLDDWNLSVRLNKPVDLIWCDVNGSEGNFIAGAAATLSRTKYLYIEFCIERLFAKSLNRYQIETALPGFEVVGEYSVGPNYGNLLMKNKNEKLWIPLPNLKIV